MSIAICTQVADSHLNLKQIFVLGNRLEYESRLVKFGKKSRIKDMKQNFLLFNFAINYFLMISLLVATGFMAALGVRKIPFGQ